MDIKKCEEALFKLAGKPEEKDLKGMRIFGLPAVKFTKKALLYAIRHLLKEQDRKREEHKHNIDFLTSLRR